MSSNKILFPTDFSRISDAALPWAASLARDRGAQLIILHVHEPRTAYMAGEWYTGVPEPNPDEVRQSLAKVRPKGSNVYCTHRTETGNPAKEIVRVADEENVDMIVMSTHGRTGLTHALLGSVAERVARKARCPVLIVKQAAG
jgi:universal stress protein A